MAGGLWILQTLLILLRRVRRAAGASTCQWCLIEGRHRGSFVSGRGSLGTAGSAQKSQKGCRGVYLPVVRTRGHAYGGPCLWQGASGHCSWAAGTYTCTAAVWPSSVRANLRRISKRVQRKRTQK